MKHRVIKKGFPRIVQTWNNGAKVYRVDCRKEGWSGQKRFDFCSEQVARAKAKEIEKIFLKQGVEGAKLTLADRIKVQSAAVPLNEFNQRFGSAYSVDEAVHFFIRAMQEQKAKLLAPKVKDAVEQFLAAKFDPNGGKGNRQLSSKTLNELKSVGKILTEKWSVSITLVCPRVTRLGITVRGFALVENLRFSLCASACLRTNCFMRGPVSQKFLAPKLMKKS